MMIADSILIALIALIIERVFGYPDWLYKRIKHPVVWIGALINLCDKALNRPNWSTDTRQAMGAFSLLLVVFITLIITLPLTLFLRATLVGWLIEMLLASSLLAQKSLKHHVSDVLSQLEQGDIAGARHAVSMIVGRDPSMLDESEISKAAIESLAENTSDGITAPYFWLALFGLPGAAVYKTINTADSMIGHMSETYQAFGYVAAKIDDVANYVPARLTAGLIIIASAFNKQAMSAVSRDAKKHKSPNAGWPEAAMAGALGVMLGGKRAYEGKVLNLPTMGDGRSTLTVTDLKNALKIYSRTLTLLIIFGVLMFALTLLLAF